MGLDFLIVHVDGDVAYSSYRDANLKTERTDLPCAHDGDPVRRIGEVLQKIVSSWMMNAIEPARRVFCLPFINTEAWAGYLAYTEYRRIFSEQSSEEEINRWLLMAGGKKANQRKRKESALLPVASGRYDNRSVEYAVRRLCSSKSI